MIPLLKIIAQIIYSLRFIIVKQYSLSGENHYQSKLLSNNPPRIKSLNNFCRLK